MNSINESTLDRYLAQSTLPEADRKKLREEFRSATDKDAVLQKAVRLSGRKAMTKTPMIQTK